MSDILEAFSRHLETLDYTIEEGAEPGVLEAQHSDYWNVAMTEQSGGVLFQSFISVRPGADADDVHRFVNAMQSQFIVTRIYLDDEDDVAIEAWWPLAEYQAEGFERFIDAFNRDVAMMGRHPEVTEVLA
jgi:hypothetical protein